MKVNDDGTKTELKAAVNNSCDLDHTKKEIVECFKKQSTDELKRKSIVETFKQANQGTSNGAVSEKSSLNINGGAVLIA